MEKLDRATHVLQEDAEKGTVQIYQNLPDLR